MRNAIPHRVWSFRTPGTIRVPVLVLFFPLLIAPRLAAMDLGYLVSLERPALRDDLLLPLAFRGGGLSLGVLAQWQDNRWGIEGQLSVGMGYVANRFGHGGVQWPVTLSIFPSWTIPMSTETSAILIGLPLTASLRDYYLFSWDDAHLYWLTAHWAGLGIEYSTRVTQYWSLRCRLQTPFISAISRPPDYRKYKQDALKNLGFYFVRPNEGFTFAWSESFKGFDASITMQRRLATGTRAITVVYSWFAYYRGDAAFNSNFRMQYSRSWGTRH